MRLMRSGSHNREIPLDFIVIPRVCSSSRLSKYRNLPAIRAEKSKPWKNHSNSLLQCFSKRAFFHFWKLIIFPTRNNGVRGDQWVGVARLSVVDVRNQANVPDLIGRFLNFLIFLISFLFIFKEHTDDIASSNWSSKVVILASEKADI